LDAAVTVARLSAILALSILLPWLQASARGELITQPAPADVVARAWNHVVQRVGVEAACFVTLDSTEAARPILILSPDPHGFRIRGPLLQDSAWVVLYRFHPPDKPWIDAKISVIVGRTERLDRSEVSGIPNCRRDPDLCRPGITENAALEIGVREGLPSGVEPATALLRYEERRGRFLWEVNQVTRANHDSKV
jgi:hypothetical protein